MVHTTSFDLYNRHVSKGWYMLDRRLFLLLLASLLWLGIINYSVIALLLLLLLLLLLYALLGCFLYHYFLFLVVATHKCFRVWCLHPLGGVLLLMMETWGRLLRLYYQTLSRLRHRRTCSHGTSILIEQRVLLVLPRCCNRVLNYFWG